MIDMINIASKFRVVSLSNIHKKKATLDICKEYHGLHFFQIMILEQHQTSARSAVLSALVQNNII